MDRDIHTNPNQQRRRKNGKVAKELEKKSMGCWVSRPGHIKRGAYHLKNDPDLENIVYQTAKWAGRGMRDPPDSLSGL
jgi:hypothetical protein